MHGHASCVILVRLRPLSGWSQAGSAGRLMSSVRLPPDWSASRGCPLRLPVSMSLGGWPLGKLSKPYGAAVSCPASAADQGSGYHEFMTLSPCPRSPAMKGSCTAWLALQWPWCIVLNSGSSQDRGGPAQSLFLRCACAGPAEGRGL